MMSQADNTPSVWIIGDVHGHTALLEALLSGLPRGTGDTTVFLGDYIDRGPDSAAVVRRVLAEHDAAPERTVLLWGNHEDMAAEHFGVPAPSKFQYDPFDWFRNGGFEAMASWGVKQYVEVLLAPCPDELTRLFSLLRTFYRVPSELSPDSEAVICAHAGVTAYEEPEAATAETLLWVRSEFLDFPQPPGRIIVHGHTPFKDVRVIEGKVGLDTGAAYGGPLTALQLPQCRLYQAHPDGTFQTRDLPNLNNPPRFK